MELLKEKSAKLMFYFFKGQTANDQFDLARNPKKERNSLNRF